MKQFKVIKSKNQSTGLPIQSTIITALVLDRLNAAQWIWITMGSIHLIFWIFAIVRLALQDEVDLFPENESPKDNKSLAQRLDEIKEKR